LSKADQRDEQHDAAQDHEPEQRGDEIVEDQVLGFGRAGSKGFRAGFADGFVGVLGVHGR
jgi:hypothetical protein